MKPRPPISLRASAVLGAGLIALIVFWVVVAALLIELL